MNVVYSSSDSYSLVAGVSMYSLMVNNKECEELNIFLIDNGITDLYVTVGTNPLYSSFSNKDDKGFYQMHN